MCPPTHVVAGLTNFKLETTDHHFYFLHKLDGVQFRAMQSKQRWMTNSNLTSYFLSIASIPPLRGPRICSASIAPLTFPRSRVFAPWTHSTDPSLTLPRSRVLIKFLSSTQSNDRTVILSLFLAEVTNNSCYFSFEPHPTRLLAVQLLHLEAQECPHHIWLAHCLIYPAGSRGPSDVVSLCPSSVRTSSGWQTVTEPDCFPHSLQTYTPTIYIY